MIERFEVDLRATFGSAGLLIVGAVLFASGCSGDGDTSGAEPFQFETDAVSGGSGGSESSGGTSTSGGSGGTAGSGSGGSSGFDSGLSDNAELDDLGEEELEQICEAFENWWDDLEPTSEQTCLYRAHVLTETESPDTDQEAREFCAESKKMCLARDDVESVECETDGFGECSATVGEFERCIEGFFSDYAETLEDLPACQEVDVEWYENWEETVFEPPSECDPVRRKCPDFFGGA